MILFFSGITSSSRDSVFQKMIADGSLVLTKKQKVFNPIQVESQIPTWLKKDVDGRNTISGMIEFLQSYYDWLSNEYGYTGINVMNIDQIMEIDNSSDYLLEYYVRTFAPDISGVYELDESVKPTIEQIKNTINNIKLEIYQRKSNEDAFKSIMASLFGQNPEQVILSYPKRKLLRLNAGKLDWMSDSDYYGTTGEYSPGRYTIVGSHLNQGVIQDGKLWQEYSYLLTSEIEDTNPYYEQIVKETLHPAGLLGLYEKKEVYFEGGYREDPVSQIEIPKIANYYPYTLGSSISLPKCSGCSGSLFVSGWTFPTFAYPSWDYEISTIGPSANFGSIILSDFFRLNSATGSTSPNDIIGTSCVFACTATGSASFTWSVIRGSTEYFGLTGISANEVITFINESSFGFDRYLWQFATGATSGLEGPTYSYGTTGIRGVTLTAFKDSISYQSIKGATFRIL